VREGVTLCAPWVEVYERELEAALRASGRELLPMPTAELHPNASPDLLQLMRDGWRHDAHRANLPGRPDPWEELVALRLLGVAMNRLLPEHVELAEVSLLEARSEPRPGRPEGCICDFASTGHHRFSCLRQGQVVLPVEGSPESGFRVR
jgi:hypothetical protein